MSSLVILAALVFWNIIRKSRHIRTEV